MAQLGHFRFGIATSVKSLSYTRTSFRFRTQSRQKVEGKKFGPKIRSYYRLRRNLQQGWKPYHSCCLRFSVEQGVSPPSPRWNSKYHCRCVHTVGSSFQIPLCQTGRRVVHNLDQARSWSWPSAPLDPLLPTFFPVSISYLFIVTWPTWMSQILPWGVFPREYYHSPRCPYLCPHPHRPPPL